MAQAPERKRPPKGGYAYQFLSGGDGATHAVNVLMDLQAGLGTLALIFNAYHQAKTGVPLVNHGYHEYSPFEGPIPGPLETDYPASQMLVLERPELPERRVVFDGSGLVIPL